jgi:hypothetical protein
MDPADIAHDDPGIPNCAECNSVLEIELWILEPGDVALLHVCARHGVAAISRPFR